MVTVGSIVNGTFRFVSANVRFILFIMGHELGRLGHELAVDRMLYFPIQGNGDGFLHFIAHHLTDSFFSAVAFCRCRFHSKLLLAFFRCQFCFQSSDERARFANVHRVFDS